MIARGRIQDPAVVDEFEHLMSRLRGLLSQSLDVDGNLIVADPNLAIVPTGFIGPYAGGTVPNGWVLCDGRQLSRVDYKALFDVTGTTWGVGDGSTTFNVPDSRGRALIGSGTGSGLTARALGATVGEETHALITAELPAHAHDLTTSSGAGGTLTVTTANGTGVTTSGLVQSAGSGTAHQNMQPSLVATMMIFANRQTV